mmetsp:Transcript_4437/g.7251  ORF Transcript_4437/g.7251 Transcript_4437/m.7251 type:complete len:256 (-) Transcript_4437:1060-1827(-)
MLQSVGHHHLLHLVVQHLLDELAEALGGRLLLLERLLLVLGLVDVQALLGGAHQLLALELLQLLHGVLVNGVHHVQHLVALLLELLEERRGLHALLGLAGDVVDVRLLGRHAAHVVVERGHLLARLGGVVAQELGQLGAVLAVLVDAKLDVLAELLVELAVLLRVFAELADEVDGLLDQVLLDDAQDLVLLQGLARDVQGQILRVHHTLHEGEPLGHQVLAVVHDEHSAHVELDGVVLLLVGALEHIEGGSLGRE